MYPHLYAGLCLYIAQKQEWRISYITKKLTHCSKTYKRLAKMLMALNEKLSLPTGYHETIKINKVLAISKICENSR